MPDRSISTLGWWRHEETVEIIEERIDDPPATLTEGTVRVAPALLNAALFSLAVTASTTALCALLSIFDDPASGAAYGAFLGMALVVAFFMLLGHASRGDARTRLLWRLVQRLKLPFGRARMKRERHIEVQRVEVPVVLELDEGPPPRLRWRFKEEDKRILGRRKVSESAWIASDPRPRVEAGEITLREHHAAFGLSRDPERPGVLTLEVRDLEGGRARLALEIEAALDPEGVEVGRLPVMKKRGVGLPPSEQARWVGALGEIADALGEPLQREVVEAVEVQTTG